MKISYMSSVQQPVATRVVNKTETPADGRDMMVSNSPVEDSPMTAHSISEKIKVMRSYNQRFEEELERLVGFVGRTCNSTISILPQDQIKEPETLLDELQINMDRYWENLQSLSKLTDQINAIS